jgi:hypothetical protein
MMIRAGWRGIKVGSGVSVRLGVRVMVGVGLGVVVGVRVKVGVMNEIGVKASLGRDVLVASSDVPVWRIRSKLGSDVGVKVADAVGV